MYKWCTIAPINSDYYDVNHCFDIPKDLGEGVILSTSPAWFKEFSRCGQLCIDEKGEIDSANYTIRIEYEATSRNEADPKWKGKKERGELAKKGKGQMADARLMYANLALWLAKPSCIGFCFLFDFKFKNDKWNIMGRGRRIARLVPNLHYTNNSLTEAELETAAMLFSRLHVLLNYSDGTLKRCASTLFWALIHKEWDKRYLLLWMALESLFAPKDRKSITYKLTKNLACFLGDNKSDISKFSEQAVKYYKWRCLIVHGKSLSELIRVERREQLEIQYETEDWLRKSLMRILSCEKRISIFDSNQRDTYLKSLRRKTAI